MLTSSLLHLHSSDKVSLKDFPDFFSLKNWDLLRMQGDGVFTAPSKFWPLPSLFALTGWAFHMVGKLLFPLNPVIALPSPNIFHRLTCFTWTGASKVLFLVIGFFWKPCIKKQRTSTILLLTEVCQSKGG